MPDKVSNAPIVSVIIPVYKVEAYLPVCVESVRRQTLKDIEIILVDDGSPDGCPALCDEYAREDSRIRVIHKANAGLGYARNSGLDIARGKWVSFVDSDDYIALNTLEACVAVGESNDVDQVRFLYETFGCDGETALREVDVTCYLTVLREFPEKTYPLLGGMIHDCGVIKSCVKSTASAWAGIYRREAIERAGLRFPSEREMVSEDYVFNVDFAALSGGIAYMQERFYFYRQNPESLSKFRADRMERTVPFCRKMQERFRNLGYPEADYMATSMMLSNLRTHMRHIFKSDMTLADKRRSHGSAVNIPYLDELARRGEYKRMSMLPRIAFMCRRSYFLSYLLSTARDLLK